MAKQSVNIGSSINFSGSILLDSDLIAGGATAYLRVFSYIASGTFTHFTLRISTSTSSPPGFAGPEFTSAVEENPTAFTLVEATAGELVVPGPNAPGVLNQDPSEPYGWGGAIEGFAAQVNTWIGELGGGDITLTIDDGVILTIELTGGSLTAASSEIATTGGVLLKDPLGLTGGALTAAWSIIDTRGAPTLTDVADLELTGGSVAAASAEVASTGAPTLALIPLVLADFVLPAGQLLVTSALIEAEVIDSGTTESLWIGTASGRATEVGELLDGSLELEPGYEITSVRKFSNSIFQLNDNPDPDDIEAFFATGGNGNAFEIHLQDKGGVASFDADTVTVDATTNANRWRVDTPAGVDTIMNRIATGDRFILAFTRTAALDLTGGSVTAASAAISTTGAVVFTGGFLNLAGGAITAAWSVIDTRGAPTLTDPADLELTGGSVTAASASVSTTGALVFTGGFLDLTGGAITAGSATVDTTGAPTLTDAADLVLTGGSLTAASAAISTTGAVSFREPLKLTGGEIRAARRRIRTRGAPTLTDPADLELTGGSLTAASAAIASSGRPVMGQLRLAGGFLTAASASIGTTGRPALTDPSSLDLTGGAITATAQIRTTGRVVFSGGFILLTGGSITAASASITATGTIIYTAPPAEPLLAFLSLEADISDGLASGFPAVIALSGDVTLEAWQPGEAQVEMRTLRATSDVTGPIIHTRARSLVEETVTILLDDAEKAEQADRLFNAVNRGAMAWLRVQIYSYGSIWRSPIKSGSIRLDSTTLQDVRGRRRYHVTVTREPWFELRGSIEVLPSTALRSRTPIAFTSPAGGSVAAPLILTLRASSAITSPLRIHLFQDRAVPAMWTPAYQITASSSTKPTGEHRRIDFAAEAPTGKNLGRDHDYEPVLAPIGATNAAAVRSMRGGEILTLGFGRSSTDISEETEPAALGHMQGEESIFTGFGDVGIGEDSDHYTITAYGDRISGTDWRLVNAPADGYHAVDFPSGVGAGAHDLQVQLFAAPSQRCVLLTLIETLGAAGAEYTGSALSIEASIRPRVSEVI